MSANDLFANIVCQLDMLRTNGHLMSPDRFRVIRNTIMQDIDMMVLQNDENVAVRVRRLGIQGPHNEPNRLQLQPVNEPMLIWGSPYSPLSTREVVSPMSPIETPPRMLSTLEANGGGWVQVVHRNEAPQAINIPQPQLVQVRQPPQQLTWAEQWRQLKHRNKRSCIGRARFEARCKDDCAICLDKHTNGESVVTECGHTFGSQCWETWMSNPSGNHTCPTCRHNKPKTTFFAMRVDRRGFRAQVADQVAEQIF